MKALTRVLLALSLFSAASPRAALAVPLRTHGGADQALLEVASSPYQEAFRARLRQEPDALVCLFQVSKAHAAHDVLAGCISARGIRDEQIESRRNEWSLFSSLKVQVDKWTCGDKTIDTPGRWFHVSDLTLDDADDWISSRPEEKELVSNAFTCHAVDFQAPSTASGSDGDGVGDGDGDGDGDGVVATSDDEERALSRRDGSLPENARDPERLSFHGSDHNQGRGVSNAPPTSPGKDDGAPSSSCSLPFKTVCAEAKAMSSPTKEFWLAGETMHHVCGAVMAKDTGSAEFECCEAHFRAVVAIVTSPCRDRGDNGEWVPPSPKTWETMCAQDDYARLLGVDAVHKPWTRPHYPTWPTESPYTYAWEKESSDISIINYYRPDFMGTGSAGDAAWLKLCPSGAQPCIPPYCPRGAQACVENGWLHKSHHSNRGLELWRGGKSAKWFDANPSIVRRKEVEGGKLMLESVEESPNKMVRVHYCTNKRDAHTALRCLDHLAEQRVLTKNQKNHLSLKYYNALVIKTVRICKEREPGGSPSSWKPLGFSGEGAAALDPGHPCTLPAGDRDRPDKACATPVSEEFLNCFQDKMRSNHADRHKFKKASDNAIMNKKARELFDFVDHFDTKNDAAKQLYRKTLDTYEKEWHCHGEDADECEKITNRRTNKVDSLAIKMRRSAFMSISNVRRIRKGISVYETGDRLEGDVMDILCWEDFVKIQRCDHDEKSASQEGTSCVPSKNFVDYFPSGHGLIQELATLTWEIAHAKCEPTLGLAYAQILDITAMFPLSRTNLHFHLVMDRPPSKHSDCYVLDQIEECARQYDRDRCLCSDPKDYQGMRVKEPGRARILNPDWINSKKALSSPQQVSGNKLYQTNQGIATLSTIMNDWAATVTYPDSVKTEFLTPWDSADAEKLIARAGNGYLQRNNPKIKAVIDGENDGKEQLEIGRYDSSFNFNNFLDRIESKDSQGHNWGKYKRAYVAFRTANVYGGTRIGFEFRGGLAPAPKTVIAEFRRTMTDDARGGSALGAGEAARESEVLGEGEVAGESNGDGDTSTWTSSEPWQHPLFVQRALLNLDEIGRKGLDAHVQVDVTNVVLRNMKVARYKIKHGQKFRRTTVEQLEGRLEAAQTADAKDAIRAEIQDFQKVIDENKRQAAEIEKHRNDKSTLRDAMAWIEEGKRLVSPSFFAYAKGEPSFEKHCGADGSLCVKWTSGRSHDNTRVLGNKRVWFPRSMVDFTFKVVASETKPSQYCMSLGLRNVAFMMRGAEHLALQWSQAYNSDDARALCKDATASGKCTGFAEKTCKAFCGAGEAEKASIAQQDLYLHNGDTKAMTDGDFFFFLGLMDDCLSDLWTRWSFAFQSRSWESIFLKKGSPSSLLTSTKHSVKEFDRELVRELLWDNPRMKSCSALTKEERSEMIALEAVKASDRSVSQSSRAKQLHALEHRCWLLVMNGMGLPPNKRLSQHAL